MSRLAFRLSGVVAAAGFFVLLFGRHWYDAIPVWVLAALMYVIARRIQRKGG